MTTPTSLLARTYTEGVAVVMPAYREEENLRATVEDFLTTLENAGHTHRVVVVNDGSPDGTGAILDELAARYPDRVVAVHHEVNRGYGAAVRSGIAAALGGDLRWVFLTDSDGQFKAEDLLTFLELRDIERADGIIGYRKVRADPLRRKINAGLWTVASRMLLRTGSRDVDCAYKLLDRRLLDGVELVGEAAAISPELLAKVRGAKPRILEHPVNHYPRLHGHQTGANLSVVLRSLLGLLRVYLDLVRAERRWPVARRLLNPADPVLGAVTVVAVVAAVTAYVLFWRNGGVLAYPDAISHVLISRRVVDSPTAGAAQLGGVWLPLPHLLTLPLVWLESLYITGFAASVVSMAAYVLAARYLYLTGREMSGSRVAGVVAAGIFALNPNVLYLQSTPMTETLLLGTIAAGVYHLYRWCQVGQYRHLAAASAAVLLATLTRYEGWVFAIAVAAVVSYTALRRWRGYAQLESHLIFFGVIAFCGIGAWLLWNQVIFGDALNWQSGNYAKPSLWVSADEAAIGDIGVSIQTYLTAMTYDIGLATLIAGGLGLVAYGYRHRVRAAFAAPYSLLLFLPFFVYALYAGQRPLHVPEIDGDLYNVRFGLVMVLPVALFTGFGVAFLRDLAPARAGRLVAALAAVAALATITAVPGVATLDEARTFAASGQERANRQAADWLRENYDGGLVLMESFGNETVTFWSQIPTGEIVYEGSFRRWEPALADPAGNDIRWIYLRTTTGNQDEVYRQLAGTPALADNYVLAYSDSERMIYQIGGTK